MIIPRHVAGQMILVDTAPVEIQRKIQQGCLCCGWSGDPFLILQAIPPKYGRGWAVMHKEPNTPAVIVFRSDVHQQQDPMHIDHRVITYLAEARKNYENKELMLQMMEKHDAQVDRDRNKQEAEMIVGMSEMVGAKLRKEGKVSKKHKIDRKRK